MALSDMLLGGRCLSMTSFFSIAYLGVFLPVCLLIYAVIPQKLKKGWLLLSSLGFYWLISGKLIIYLILSILSVHYFGLWLDKLKVTRQKEMEGHDREEKKLIKEHFNSKMSWVVALAVILHVGVLLTLKYSGFFIGNFNSLLNLMGFGKALTIPKYLVPIGISFFTLQALSYILDVKRDTVKAETNIFKLALFMSFFPQIVEGPICRYYETSEQLWNCSGITYVNLTRGIQRILYGMMKKIVVADRLDPFVKLTFNDYASLEGGVVLFGVICYTIQLYMDFSGSIDAVIGTAEIFGIEMPENFKRPFFSKNISEFWQRWHVTLGLWFKDYIFYPVTTSGSMKKITSKARKKLGNHYGPLIAGSIALFCVWLCNGLWHGSGWNYIFFGMYHFIWILLGSVFTPVSTALFKTIKLDPECFLYRLFRIIRTTFLVIVGELFFRAYTVRDGFAIIKRIFTDFTFNEFFADPIRTLHIDKTSLAIVLFVVILVYIVGIIQEKGIVIRDVLARQHIVIRWIGLFAFIVFIIIFAAYGDGFTPVDPMYAQF